MASAGLPVVAVSSGGTSTECAVVDSSGAVLAHARTGPSNPLFISLEEARSNVTAALDAALPGIERCRAAGVALFEGVADDRDEVTTVVLAPLARRTATVYRYTEHEAALASCGIIESEGVAVVAGTGSSAVAMHRGRRASAGGWGAVLGDQGSAYDIAIWAIRAAIQSFDGSRASLPILERRVKEHFGIRALRDLVTRFHGMGVRREEVADLCRVIAEDAANEPAIAARFGRAGQDLASLAVAAANHLYAANEAPAFAMAGGVWGAGAVVEAPFVHGVRGAYPGARFHPQVCTPAVGVARRVLRDQVTQ